MHTDETHTIMMADIELFYFVCLLLLNKFSFAKKVLIENRQPMTDIFSFD